MAKLTDRQQAILKTIKTRDDKAIAAMLEQVVAELFDLKNDIARIADALDRANPPR